MLSAMRDMEYPMKYKVVAISTPVSVWPSNGISLHAL